MTTLKYLTYGLLSGALVWLAFEAFVWATTPIFGP